MLDDLVPVEATLTGGAAVPKTFHPGERLGITQPLTPPGGQSVTVGP